MQFKAVCFGEVLWDVFTNRKIIGGAPLNVALRLQSFSVETTMISSVGTDENGQELLNYLKSTPLNVNSIQKQSVFKTGVVSVELDNSGSATYEIDFPAAWDKIKVLERDIKGVSEADVLIYGSLSCRDKVSRATLITLQKHAKFNVFDVNLRAPHYTKETLKTLMIHSNFIKFNDDEILELCGLYSLNISSLEEQIKAMAIFANVDKICVTRGSKGAVLFIENHFFYNPGILTKVIDTVGAGDSFLAGLIFKLLSKESHQKSLDFACAVGSLVASYEGANPIIEYPNV